MLLIFDLDDTLLDTYHSIIPVMFREALVAMMQEGLIVKDLDASLDRLLKLYVQKDSGTCRDVLNNFLLEQREEKYLEKGVQVVYGSLPEDLSVRLMDGALSLLQDLKKDHDLALVTRGKKEVQKQKLEKTGLDCGFFSSIAIVEGGDKKPYYALLAHQYGYPSDKIVVCGDRITFDLQPAKELSFYTIHLQKREDAVGLSPSMWVDYVVQELREIPPILLQIEKGKKDDHK